MKASKINPKILKRACKEKGVSSISELAEQFNCSREAIYFAMEMPNRYPRIYRKILEFCS